MAGTRSPLRPAATLTPTTSVLRPPGYGPIVRSGTGGGNQSNRSTTLPGLSTSSGGGSGSKQTGEGGGGGGGGGSDSGGLYQRCPKTLPWWLIPLAALGIVESLALVAARK